MTPDFDPAAAPLLEAPEPGPARATLVLRALAIGLASLALGFAGGLTWPLAPWGAMALPLGLALATLWRWGPVTFAAALLGALVSQLGLGQPVLQALGAAATLGASAWTARVLLRAASFDARLERARDIAGLVVMLPLAAAVPVALLAATLPAPPALGSLGAPSTARVLFTGGVLLVLGSLVSTLTTFALDRRVLHALQPQAPWPETLLAALGIVSAWALLWLMPGSSPLGLALALMWPLVVFTAIALRGHLTMAASGLLVAMLLAAGVAGANAPWGALSPNGALAVWTATALALLLAAHANTAEWRARAQRWEWALDGSHLGVADWHPGRGDGFASVAWRALGGFHDRRWTPQAWVRQVHIEDRDPLERAIGALAGGKAGRVQLELRMPRPAAAKNDEQWHWFEATLLVIERDAADRPTRLLATLADVQQRRDAQERQLMSVNLFQHLHEGLLVTDAELRALDVNPAYTQILGVPRDEVIGTVPSLLRPTPADPVARQQRAAMWASLREQGSWRGELLERRRNGQACTLQTTISTVHGSAGDLRYHVLVIADISEQRQQREQLERQAHFDELTRLPNRARLSQLLDDAMRAADRDGYLLVVCYLDLDRFKPVNDKYGHAAGDRLLAELAGRLRSALRSRESWADSAARLGGDEFVLLLRAGTIEEARLAVERVLRVVGEPYVIDPAEDPVQVTASMGATIYPIDRSDAETLLRHADHAMYQAKQSGRNGWLFFDPEHRRRTEERVMAIGRVQEALDQSEFVLYYQPKVDMRSGRVLGFEALLRWDHPQQGLVAPLQFLPLIENTGLSSRIGDWVISQALEHLTQWKHAGLDISVSVNVSARHLQEPDFALRLAELLARHSEPLATRLELEMLETAAHADIEATSALLARCRALGVRFALDDFGTGYSTLTYLKRLPVDVLKIDRSFVSHMLDDGQDRAIVEGVIGLARTFGCAVVAEGVESPAQARTLLEMGCDIGQGTGIAAPMRADQVATWVREYRGMFALAPATLQAVVAENVRPARS
jgi:diguanylate cyclase (GGDEF)-like protein/PAS domain S-box-containing protein